MHTKAILVANLISSMIILAPTSQAVAKTRDFPILDLRATEWMSMANASWQTSFPENNGTGKSELNYDDIDSNILLLEAHIRPVKTFSLAFNLGGGTIDNAQHTDTDLNNDRLYSESKGDVDGDVKLWGVNMYCHLVTKEPQTRGWLDFFVGYQHYQDKLRMFNGHQTISDPGLIPPYTEPAPAGTTYPAQNSTYDFEWNYIQLGTQTGYSFISDPQPNLHDVGISASLAYIPFVEYTGTGIWNLSQNYAQDPSFEHKSNRGWGVDANIAFNYKPCRTMTFMLGYRYFQLEAKNGTNTTYWNSGSRSTSNLDKVSVMRHGPFISFITQF